MNTLKIGENFAGYRLLKEVGHGDRTWRRVFMAECIGDQTAGQPEADRPKAAMIVYALDGLPVQLRMSARNQRMFIDKSKDANSTPRVREIGYYFSMDALHVQPILGCGEQLHEGQMYAWVALEWFDDLCNAPADGMYAKILGLLFVFDVPAHIEQSVCTEIFSMALQFIMHNNRLEGPLQMDEITFAFFAAGFDRPECSGDEEECNASGTDGNSIGDNDNSDDNSDDNGEEDEVGDNFDPDFFSDLDRDSSTAARITKAQGRGFKDVAGMGDLKMRLERDFVNILKNRDMAAAYNITPPNGLLLYGAPGCGKTFIAQKIAEESGLNFAMVKPSDLGSVYIHGSQTMIADLFRKAKAKAPTILCLDEVDAMIHRRTNNENMINHDNEVNEFLTQMNNCAERGVYIIGMTNRPDRIDPAMLRKGRFDELIYIPLPDTAARREIFALELARRPAVGIDLDRLAALTERYTAGDIAYIVREASREKFERSLKESRTEPAPLDQEILERIIARVRPSVSPDDLCEYEKMHLRLSQQKEQNRRRCIGF